MRHAMTAPPVLHDLQNGHTPLFPSPRSSLSRSLRISCPLEQELGDRDTILIDNRDYDNHIGEKPQEINKRLEFVVSKVYGQYQAARASEHKRRGEQEKEPVPRHSPVVQKEQGQDDFAHHEGSQQELFQRYRLKHGLHASLRFGNQAEQQKAVCRQCDGIAEDAQIHHGKDQLIGHQ